MAQPNNATRALLLGLAIALGMTASAPALSAQGSADIQPANDSAAKALSQMEAWLARSVNLPNGQSLRIEVKVGRLPRGLRLPECTRAEPFLPPNTKLWGRANVGLRCVEGGRWQTWIPVRISAWGPAVVARRNLVPGRPFASDDVEVSEVDWAAAPHPPLSDRAALNGRELLRPVPAGRPILTDHLRKAASIRQGDTVPIKLTGTGFEIHVLGTALASGSEGERIGIRTPTGKVLNGRIEGTSVNIAR